MKLMMKKGKSQKWEEVEGGFSGDNLKELELTLSLGNGDIFDKIGIPYEAFETATFDGFNRVGTLKENYLIVHMNKSWRLDFVIS